MKFGTARVKKSALTEALTVMALVTVIDMYMSVVPLISCDLGNLAYRTVCDVTRGG
jgi:hypothetical protein